MRSIFLTLLMFIGLVVCAQYGSRQAAYDFNKRLGRGINFMASKINQDHHYPSDFELIKDNKFTHVRIGSRVWQHVGPAPEYTIDPDKLSSYKNAVDWALDHDLMVMVDPIHAWTDYTNDSLPKLIKLWEQLATTFADYPIDRVAFEIFNEPASKEIDLEALIGNSLYEIRNIPQNEERIVVVSGQSFSTRQALIDAFNNNVAFPTDDPYLIGTFHYYDPRPFTKQGTFGVEEFWADEGDSDPEWDETIDKFQEVVEANNNWASINSTIPLPIYMGEYGVDNAAPSTNRIRWLWWVRMVCEKNGFSNALWNLYNNSPTSKGFGPWDYDQIHDPSTRYLDQYVLDPYRNRYEGEDTQIDGNFVVEEWIGTSDNFVISTYNGISGENIIFNEVYIARTGNYDVTMRYMNNSNDPVNLYVASIHNNQTIDSLKFRLDASNDVWNSVKFPLDFITSTDDQILLRLDGSVDSFHLDYIAITNGLFYDNLFPSEETDIHLLGYGNNFETPLNIYPNPASEKIYIAGEFQNWQLYDSSNKFLNSGTNNEIPLFSTKPGLYFLMVDNEPFKFIIQ